MRSRRASGSGTDHYHVGDDVYVLLFRTDIARRYSGWLTTDCSSFPRYLQLFGDPSDSEAEAFARKSQKPQCL
jgi:hypothetical protein